MKTFAVLLALLVVSCPSPVLAQEDKLVCIELSVHRKIAADLLELRGDPDKPKSTGLRGRVALLVVQADLHAAQVVDLTLARDLAVQGKEVAAGALTAAVAGKRKAEADRDAWHRSPTLWLALGVVGALVIAVTVDKIQE